MKARFTIEATLELGDLEDYLDSEGAGGTIKTVEDAAAYERQLIYVGHESGLEVLWVVRNTELEP